jgi:hypothetical protein
MDIFSKLVQDAERLGHNPKENLDLTKKIADFVNSGTGRGSLGELENSTLALSTFFYSPRLMASRLKLLNPVYYITQPSFVRKEALKTLFTFTGSGITILTIAKLGGAQVEIDPRSTDYGKIKTGNTRIDIWGGFQQYFVLASRLISGKIISSTTGKEYVLGEGYKPLTRLDILGRAIEYKEAPVFSFATNLLRGQTVFGEKISIPKEVGKRFVPMVMEDIYDLAKDDPKLLPLGILGIFGVGLQTYKPQSKKGFKKHYEGYYKKDWEKNWEKDWEKDWEKRLKR